MQIQKFFLNILGFKCSWLKTFDLQDVHCLFAVFDRFPQRVSHLHIHLQPALELYTGDVLDLAAANDIVVKSGAWYNYNNEKIGQGRENAKKYLEKYHDSIECVSVGGESGEGPGIRVLNYGWVIETEMQCTVYRVPFRFHQTGTYLQRGNKLYTIPRSQQESQAHKAGIDYTPHNEWLSEEKEELLS